MTMWTRYDVCYSELSINLQTAHAHCSPQGCSTAAHGAVAQRHTQHGSGISDNMEADPDQSLISATESHSVALINDLRWTGGIRQQQHGQQSWPATDHAPHPGRLDRLCAHGNHWCRAIGHIIKKPILSQELDIHTTPHLYLMRGGFNTHFE